MGLNTHLTCAVLCILVGRLSVMLPTASFGSCGVSYVYFWGVEGVVWGFAEMNEQDVACLAEGGQALK